MDTILTVSIDQNVAESVEIYAKHVKKSVSQLVKEYLLSISVDNDKVLKKGLCEEILNKERRRILVKKILSRNVPQCVKSIDYVQFVREDRDR